MVLTPITAARVSVVCLAASFGWGSFWAMVQTPSKHPASRAANDNGFGTLHNDATFAKEQLKTASATLVDNFVVDDDWLWSKVNLPMAHVDGISSIATLRTHSTLIESVADVSSHKRPESETIQPPPITEQSAAPKPWDELPFTEVVALFWGEFSRNAFPMAWPIVASLPFDCLLMFFVFGWSRWGCSGKKPNQSTERACHDERNLNGVEEPEASHDVADNLDDAMQASSEAGGAIDVRSTSLATDVDRADVHPTSLQPNDKSPSAEQTLTRISVDMAPCPSREAGAAQEVSRGLVPCQSRKRFEVGTQPELSRPSSSSGSIYD